MNKNDSILVLGSKGLVGSAILRELKHEGYVNILSPAREELELLNQKQTLDYFLSHKPHAVFMAAAKVGGIQANNQYRADFIFENLSVQQNVFNAAFKVKTPKLLFLGSSCIYPKNCPQPIKEDYLLSGPLEPTNEPYAIAKIAGLKSVESFRRQYNLDWFSVMPTNLYGINDNFHLENSHVIPGLIARLYQAILNNHKEFKVWGTGKSRREFLFVDDMARACLHVMNFEGLKPDFLNIGTGIDITIAEVANLISKKMKFKGKIVFDQTKPDGTPKKLLDTSKITQMGWKPRISFEDGLEQTIDFYLKKQSL